MAYDLSYSLSTPSSHYSSTSSLRFYIPDCFFNFWSSSTWSFTNPIFSFFGMGDRFCFGSLLYPQRISVRRLSIYLRKFKRRTFTLGSSALGFAFLYVFGVCELCGGG